jgi:hypothetical protein
MEPGPEQAVLVLVGEVDIEAGPMPTGRQPAWLGHHVLLPGFRLRYRLSRSLRAIRQRARTSVPWGLARVRLPAGTE